MNLPPVTCLCGHAPDLFKGRYERHECPLVVWAWIYRRGAHASRPPIDWLNKDTRYWKALRKETIALGLQLPDTTNIAHLYRRPADTSKVWKVVTAYRYQERCRAAAAHLESPVAQYGAVIGGWVQDHLDAAMRDCGDLCIDNSRWGRVRNSCDMRRYRREKANGCCGYHDELIEHPKYGRFLIGFNYGH